ncbi:Uncharacterized protein Fot_43372 [Forsythia ovata]|uniref:Uncharacterized protein n=1 Tax=Forsythia ovata TaxID=205694 RepID=A0ABD1RNW2_9LAMI
MPEREKYAKSASVSYSVGNFCTSSIYLIMVFRFDVVGNPRNCHSSVKRKASKAKPTHLCQRSLDQAGCKSRDVHEWQGPEGESQQANPQDRPPQYFSENLPHTKIEPALPEDFSPLHRKPYQLAYAPGGKKLPLLKAPWFDLASIFDTD